MPPSDRRQAAPRFNTLDKDESRRGREDTTIQLRKDKRNEQLQKKRFGQGAADMGMGMGAAPGQQSLGSQAWAESEPQKLVQGVLSDDPNLQLPAVTQFRKLLSIERSPPIEEVIAAGVVPRFVQFLQARAAQRAPDPLGHTRSATLARRPPLRPSAPRPLSPPPFRGRSSPTSRSSSSSRLGRSRTSHRAPLSTHASSSPTAPCPSSSSSS